MLLFIVLKFTFLLFFHSTHDLVMFVFPILSISGIYKVPDDDYWKDRWKNETISHNNPVSLLSTMIVIFAKTGSKEQFKQLNDGSARIKFSNS